MAQQYDNKNQNKQTGMKNQNQNQNLNNQKPGSISDRSGTQTGKHSNVGNVNQDEQQ